MNFQYRVLFLFLCLILVFFFLRNRSSPDEQHEFLHSNTHARTSTSRILNLQLGPPLDIFIGSSTTLSGELLPRSRFGPTADHVQDDELPIVWIGIDGENGIHTICDKYWAGRISKMHIIFTRTLHLHNDEKHSVSLLNGRPRPFEVFVGDEILQEGTFCLCAYDESGILPEVAEAMENTQKEALKKGLSGVQEVVTSRKLPMGRYIYTGLHLKVAKTSEIGIHMITSLVPSQNPSLFADRLANIRLALDNRFIAEVHLLQETEDLSIFPDDIVKHRKFRYTVVRRPLTYGMAFEYGKRELEDRRVLITNPDTIFDTTLQHFQSVPSAAFYTHLYALTAQPASSLTGSRFPVPPGSYDSLILIPSQLGQIHPSTLPQPKKKDINTFQKPEPPRLDTSDLTRVLDEIAIGAPGAENRVLWEIRRWMPTVMIRNPAVVVKSWRKAREAGGRVDTGRSVTDVKVSEGFVAEGWTNPEEMKRSWLW
ncbi:hypothetical protein BC937DRAFT_92290 [Endogone sp. FLAS-F59071]|nr:hypothetical protein BC937DRAFT_92290 [Endogone sp. FLAS-F59071]|eukprot:RUS21555.1 hypothetical protein BC937DRAFT_92290 [Endogone sp. FLAS-F59071]